MIALKFILLIIFSYFIGNISNARIISKLLKVDITKQGSGNPGTMNMLRTFGFGVGLMTLILDSLKGVIPALAGFFLFKNNSIQMSYIGLYTAGLAVVIGHNFPLLYKFKGGKGVACILGIFAVAEPLWVLVIFIACFLYLLFFDYGAIASFIFVTSLTVIEAVKFKDNIIILLLLCALFFLTFYMHRQNIIRLLEGRENKVNLMKSIKSSKKQKKTIRQIKKQIKSTSEKEKNIG